MLKVRPYASPEEAAAIAAAIEGFVVETSQVTGGEVEQVSLWTRQAMFEATGQAERGFDFGQHGL